MRQPGKTRAVADSRAVYANAMLQLPDREALGSLVIEDGRIVDIAEGRSRTGIDLGGAICLPGLVELQTDNIIETVLAPRPGVRWPLELATQCHDRIAIAAGMTTVCDAIALGDTRPGSSRLEFYAPIIDVIGRGMAEERYAADHRIHLCCELVYDELIASASSPISKSSSSMMPANTDSTAPVSSE